MRVALKITAAVLIVAGIVACFMFLPKELTAGGIASSEFPDLSSYEKSNGILRSTISEKEQLLYDAIAQGLVNRDDQVVLRSTEYSSQEVETILQKVIMDHPEYFWADYSGFYYMISQMGVTLTLSYNCTSEEMAKKQQEFNAALDDYAKTADGAANQYEAALLIHDRLIEDCDYDLSGNEADVHNAYGALVKNLAVCDGYAYAYKCIMDRLGIECRTVTGTATNGIEENVGHAWNIVNLDGKYTFVDCTWDDMDASGGTRAVASKRAVTHSFFANGTDKFYLDHRTNFVQSGSEEIPRAEDISWYELNKVKGETIEDIATAAAEMLVNNLKDGVSFFEVQITDPDEYDDLYRNGGIDDIIGAANEILSDSGSEDEFADSARFYLLDREHGCIMAVCGLEEVDLAA